MLNTGLSGCGSTFTICSFKSKADAMKFAIEFTSTYDSSINRIPNYPAAQELFDFICKNVNLPDVEQDKAAEFIDYAKTILQEQCKKKPTPTEKAPLAYGDLMLLVTKLGFKHIKEQSDGVNTYRLHDTGYEYTLTISRKTTPINVKRLNQ